MKKDYEEMSENIECPKLAKFKLMLQKSDDGIISVQFNAIREGADVPAELIKDGLILNFNYRVGKRDMEITRWGLRETLSFKGQPFSVAVPWNSVTLISSRIGGVVQMMYFEEDPSPEEDSLAARRAKMQAGRSKLKN